MGIYLLCFVFLSALAGHGAVALNNDIVPTNNDIVPTNNDIVPINNDIVPINNDIVPINNDIVPTNNDIVPINNDIVPSGDRGSPMHSSSLAVFTELPVRMDESDHNQSLHQKLSSTKDKEQAIAETRQLQGIISNFVNQMRPKINQLSENSYSPRQQPSRVGVLKTDNRLQLVDQGDRSLVRNVVSTVSSAAANIGNAVLGPHNKNNKNHHNTGLIQGGVVDRVMSSVRSDYGQGGLAGVVAKIGDNLLDGALLGKLAKNDRHGGLLG